MQNCLIQMKVIESIMPWMGSANEDIIRETMSLILCLLYNANRTAQVCFNIALLLLLG